MQNQAGALVDDYYANHYARVHGSGSLGAAHRAMHQALERRRSQMRFRAVLEVGAGNLEHYPFVAHSRERYIATDIRPPTCGPLVKALESGDGPADLTFQLADATRLPYADNSIDRIVAGCLLIHLPDPLAAVVEWQRVCRPDGVIDFLVPCDPGLLSRAFRRVVSEPAAARRGVGRQVYRLVNAIEHVSSFSRVAALAGAALESDRELKTNYYPFPLLPSWNLNAFAVFSVGPAK
jgi:phosphatidylethanolamine/phosphatidyl-N-methylethanolamine N-methyltransferase